MVEKGSFHHSLSQEERTRLLKRLTEVESFGQFLHKTFVGQKRFSIEGVDTLVPMLDTIIGEGTSDSVCNVMIGMAHRGRLSVLVYVLEKPYHHIFSGFQYSTKKHVSSEDVMKTHEGWT
jgi:2-oxoglutarate dehydrogenase E1 component